MKKYKNSRLVMEHVEVMDNTQLSRADKYTP